MSSYTVWGWGDPAEEPTRADLLGLGPFVAETTGVAVQDPQTPADLPPLPASRRLRTLPPSLRPLASDDPADRARHAFGRSYRDLVRAVAGQVDSPPDLVLRPAHEQDVVDLLSWAAEVGAPVVPFGGGSSVVGGVEPRGLDAAVSLDLSRLAGLAEVDEVSRAVRLRAGTFGPAAEAALKPHGLTLRFYPQSFERSTVGGWVATRAAGHFSTRLTHIDDLVESVRAVTPAGVWESRRLPGSGAGPSPDRMLLGSEGTLGVVTEAWLRAQPRPAARWSATLAAPDLPTGGRAVRALVQAGLLPATCRLVDAGEAALTGTLATGEAALVLGFESLAGPLSGPADLALELCRDAGLRVVESGDRGAAGEAWRSTFVRAPYLRESLLLLGVLVETFETAITWDRFDALVAAVTTATTDALRRVCGSGTVTCRLTHVYPDGCAPYFTVLAPARRGSEVAQWDEVKAAAADALAAAGGTITHHHAVGRDHRPWYDRQRPDPFALALAGAKAAVDPLGILNPGVLLDPLTLRLEEVPMDGFKKFLLRGNVVDLAVAVVIGAAFSAVVTAFVSAFITPLVGVFSGAAGDVQEKTFTVGGTPFPYGQFVDALLGFVIIAAVVYFLVLQPVNRLMERFKTEPEVVSTTKQCRECLSSIPQAASRCAFCAVEQPVV